MINQIEQNQDSVSGVGKPIVNRVRFFSERMLLAEELALIRIELNRLVEVVSYLSPEYVVSNGMLKLIKKPAPSYVG